MYEISKSIEFCYGHRVWTQKLEAEFSDNLKCACRHLHGHEGKVEITLACKPQPLGWDDQLKDGMVTDFRHLSWLKKFVDDNLDHRFVIDSNDPLFVSLIGLGRDGVSAAIQPVVLSRFEPEHDKYASIQVGRQLIVSDEDRRVVPEQLIEYAESFFIVDFTPTSENFSRWLFDIVSWKMNRLARTVSVDWWETPKSHSKYSMG